MLNEDTLIVQIIDAALQNANWTREFGGNLRVSEAFGANFANLQATRAAMLKNDASG